MKKDILGIKVDDINIDEALKTVESWLSKPDKHYIVTPNPEIVVMAQQDGELATIINHADLAIPDGAGLKLSGDIVCTTPGIDLMEDLIKLAAEKGFTTAFLGGRDQVAKQTAERLIKKYPKLKVTFTESGGEIGLDGKARGPVSSQPHSMSSLANRSLRALNGAPRSLPPLALPRTDLLFVAFGPPKQEKWIYKNLDNIDVKVVMAVGGAFDYIAGKVPRAPTWIRNWGLEWLFRLMIQPWRIKRQIALLKYLWLLTIGGR